MVELDKAAELVGQCIKAAIATRCEQVAYAKKPTAAGRRRRESWEGQLDALLDHLVNLVDLHKVPAYMPEIDLFESELCRSRAGDVEDECAVSLGALPD